jgi:hypothetical protein
MSEWFGKRQPWPVSGHHRVIVWRRWTNYEIWITDRKVQTCEAWFPRQQQTCRLETVIASGPVNRVVNYVPRHEDLCGCGRWSVMCTLDWGEWSAWPLCCFTTDTPWLAGWVDPRTGLDVVAKRKVLPLSGLEFRSPSPRPNKIDLNETALSCRRCWWQRTGRWKNRLEWWSLYYNNDGNRYCLLRDCSRQ